MPAADKSLDEMYYGVDCGGVQRCKFVVGGFGIQIHAAGPNRKEALRHRNHGSEWIAKRQKITLNICYFIKAKKYTRINCVGIIPTTCWALKTNWTLQQSLDGMASQIEERAGESPLHLKLCVLIRGKREKSRTFQMIYSKKHTSRSGSWRRQLQHLPLCCQTIHIK